MASNTASGRLHASASETVRPPGFVMMRSDACIKRSTSVVNWISFVFFDEFGISLSKSL